MGNWIETSIKLTLGLLSAMLLALLPVVMLIIGNWKQDLVLITSSLLIFILWKFWLGPAHQANEYARKIHEQMCAERDEI